MTLGCQFGGAIGTFTPAALGQVERARLLFIAGGEDHIVPPSVNRASAKHDHSRAATDSKEFPTRSHDPLGPDGWEEVADDVLDWAFKNAASPQRRRRERVLA